MLHSSGTVFSCHPPSWLCIFGACINTANMKELMSPCISLVQCRWLIHKNSYWLILCYHHSYNNENYSGILFRQTIWDTYLLTSIIILIHSILNVPIPDFCVLVLVLRQNFCQRGVILMDSVTSVSDYIIQRGALPLNTFNVHMICEEKMNNS